MARQITDYRVFIASPSGLDDERRKFGDLLHKMNIRDANDRGIQFTPVGWELTLAGHGRPQELINKELAECDYFVLMLHTKWGSPTGDREGKYSSGTEEEFELAKTLLSDASKPMRQIVVLFKGVSVDMLADPGDSMKKVLEFKKRLEREKLFLYREFSSLDDFSETIQSHISSWIREHEGTSPSAGHRSGARDQSVQDSETSESLARERMNRDLRSAEALASEGRVVEAELAFAALVTAFDDPWPLARFGRFLRKTGNRHRALEVLTHAEEKARLVGDDLSAAYITRQIGQVKERNGDSQGALALYKSAIEKYEKLENASGIARSLRDLALILRKLADYPSALEALQRSERLFSELDDDDGVAAALGYRGVILKAQGKLSEALRAHTSALEIHQRTADKRGIAATKSNLGIIHRHMGRLGDARRHHQEAHSTYVELHDLQGQARELSNLGTVARHSKKFDDAIEYHTGSLAISEQLNNRHGIAIQHANLGRDYLEKGQLDRAEELHSQALQMGRTSGDVENQAWQMEALSTIALRRDQLDRARDMANHSLSLFERIGARIGVAACAKLQGQIAVAFGDLSLAREKFATSIAEFNELQMSESANEVIDCRDRLLNGVDADAGQ